jgi:hypothetical protein
MFVVEMPDLAIALKDFPGGEVPELVNLPLQNRPKDLPPYFLPLHCGAIAPMVVLAPGEKVPSARNLPPAIWRPWPGVR